MNLLNRVKYILSNNIAVVMLYVVSLGAFESLKEIPDVNIFSFNLQMIIIYFYILKFPESLGLGHIFLAGIINDVVIGTPLGTSSLSYLILSFFTNYMKQVTLRSKMTSEWITFIPALFFSNLIFFIIINNFSHLSFYYIDLLQNTFFTFLFFPIFYFLFNSIQTKVLKFDA
jgi:rod shape-determining protein MreD